MYDSYEKSDAKLISPIQNYFKKGQRYTFEIKTNDFQKIILVVLHENINEEISTRKFSMVKQGDTFKVENFLIKENYIEIYIKDNMENDLLSFSID